MNIPLSKRLQACCGYVTPGDRVADIGCDHGYTGIYLLNQNIASAVIAADINEMPLQSAMSNAERFGVRDQMSFYLSDGVRNIPRDFDTMICAGMGADTIMSILDAALWLKADRYKLILQCQSKTPALRKYLSQNGWFIHRETVLQDGRFLYTVMEVFYCPAAPRLTVPQYYFPPALFIEPSPILRQYYEDVLFRLKRAIAGRGSDAEEEMVIAAKELEELKW